MRVGFVVVFKSAARSTHAPTGAAKHDLATADDSSDSDGDGLSDLEEITVGFTDPTDPNDPPRPLDKLFVDCNADGTVGQLGPNLEDGYVAYTAPHESNTIDDPSGIDFPVFGTTVNLAVDYVDNTGFEDYAAQAAAMPPTPVCRNRWVGGASSASSASAAITS